MKKSKQMVSKRKFTGNKWVIVALVILGLTFIPIIGLALAILYWFLASETITEEMK